MYLRWSACGGRRAPLSEYQLSAVLAHYVELLVHLGDELILKWHSPLSDDFI